MTDRLSDEQVSEIRARYRAGETTQKALAVDYGISQPHVSRLIRGEMRTATRIWTPRFELRSEWLADERWKIVQAWSNYEVSTLGRVRRRTGGVGARAGYILRSRPRKDGYLSVALYQKNQRRDVLLHHLVLETFVGLRPEGMEGCHENANPADCRLANLRWDTPEANVQDKINARLASSCGEGHKLQWIENGINLNGKAKRTLICLDCRRVKARDRYHNNKKAVNE